MKRMILIALLCVWGIISLYMGIDLVISLFVFHSTKCAEYEPTVRGAAERLSHRHTGVMVLKFYLRNSDEPAVRMAICDVLGHMGPQARSALEDLRVATEDPHADVRDYAEFAIKEITEGTGR